MEKISPRIDIIFKKIFGVEENKDLLISLINSVVSDEDQVEDVTLLNPYVLKNFKRSPRSILDIKVQDIKMATIAALTGISRDDSKNAISV